MSTFYPYYEYFEENGTSAFSELGVDKCESLSNVKSVYRDLARTQHPDKGGDENVWLKKTEARDFIVNNYVKINAVTFWNILSL